MLLAAAVVATPILLAIPAHADTDDDDTYFQNLKNLNFEVWDPEQAIRQGHWICNLEQVGRDTEAEATVVLYHGQNNYSMQTAANIAVAATRAYCPWEEN
jgi:hypothetical protein